MREREAAWAAQALAPERGAWLRQPEPGDFLIYVPHVIRPDMLRRAVASLVPFEGRTVVIDQSTKAADSLGTAAKGVFRWQGPRRFTSVMNWIQQDAYRRGLRYFLLMHDDAEAAPGGVGMLLAEAERLDRSATRWGVIFTWYDALCLFNPTATRAVGPWDETFLWYVADIDYYNRLTWDGWPGRSCPAALRVHHGSQTLPGLPDAERAAVDTDHTWGVAHYRHKWGCHWSEGVDGRLWTVPYNGPP